MLLHTKGDTNDHCKNKSRGSEYGCFRKTLHQYLGNTSVLISVGDTEIAVEYAKEKIGVLHKERLIQPVSGIEGGNNCRRERFFSGPGPPGTRCIKVKVIKETTKSTNSIQSTRRSTNLAIIKSFSPITGSWKWFQLP